MNQDRSKFYFIEHTLQALVETNLRNMKHRVFRVHRLTSVHDRLMSLTSFKSELYGLTKRGFVFVLNTVQDKVLFRGRPRGEPIENHLSSKIVRHERSVLVAATTAIVPNLESVTVFYLYSKELVQRHKLAVRRTLIAKNNQPAGPDDGCLSNLLVVPLAGNNFFALATFLRTAYPLCLFFVTPQSIERIDALPASAVGEKITDIRYCMGSVLLSNSDRQIKKILIAA